MKEIALDITRGFCPECLKVINSKVVLRQDKVYLTRECQEHGRYESLHFWSNPIIYSAMSELFKKRKRIVPIGLLINLNFACNQNCNYCFAQANQRKDAPPTLQEIIEKTYHFKGPYIYLCGGEPTLRDDLFTIIRELKKKNFKLFLLTNGKKLTDGAYVKNLEKAGLDFVQLQFDTFDDKQYEILRNEKLVEIKLKAIENLKRTKIRINLWTTLVRGINDDQIGKIIRYAAQNSFIIKSVYLISAWSLGRTLDYAALSKEEIFNIINEELGISTQDFIDYKTFEHYLLEIFGHIFNKRQTKSTPCNISCRLFYSAGRIKPLTYFINFKKVNYYLKKSYDMAEAETYLGRLKFLIDILRRFFIKEFVINWRILLPAIRHRHSFSIRVGSFLDKYNLDFNIFRYCNLCTDFNGGLIPFCIREILRDKNNFKELNAFWAKIRDSI